MFITKILLLMGMHWGTRYCIYACKQVSDRSTKRI